VEWGCYFSIGVELLSSQKIQEIAAAVPADRLLTETDNPGGMKWVNGERGMPADLSAVVVELAAVRQMETGALQELVAQNFRRLLETDWPPAAAVAEF
jgi:TatD DNase family protein